MVSNVPLNLLVQIGSENPWNPAQDKTWKMDGWLEAVGSKTFCAEQHPTMELTQNFCALSAILIFKSILFTLFP